MNNIKKYNLETVNKVLELVGSIEKDLFLREVSLPYFVDEFISCSYAICENNFSLQQFDEELCLFLNQIWQLKENLEKIGISIGKLYDYESYLLGRYCNDVLDGKVNSEFFLEKISEKNISIFNYLSKDCRRGFDVKDLQPFFKKRKTAYVHFPNIKLRTRGTYMVGGRKTINIANVETFPKKSGVFKSFLEDLLCMAKENNSLVYIESVLNENLYHFLEEHPQTINISKSSNFTLNGSI